jgi:hypothetical protein
LPRAEVGHQAVDLPLAVLAEFLELAEAALEAREHFSCSLSVWKSPRWLKCQYHSSGTAEIARVVALVDGAFGDGKLLAGAHATL